MEPIGARKVCGLVAGVGLVAVAVLLLKPVDASFGDDPLLRLQAFDRPLGSVSTEVDCGSVLSSLGESSAAATLYTIARDQSCRREGYRRLIAAIAAASAILVLTLLILAVSGPLPDGAASRAGPLPDGAASRAGPLPDGAASRAGPLPDGAASRAGPLPDGRLGLGGSAAPAVTPGDEDRSPAEPG